MLGPAASWGDQEELLAAAVDWLGHIDYLLGRAHFPKATGSRPPKPVPRPGDDTRAASDGDPPVTAEELAEFLKSPM